MKRAIRMEIWALIAVCAVVWLMCAIDPVDRMTWALEQIATVMVLIAISMQRSVRYSFSSLLGLAVLFCAHTIGTHYTYSLTPYNDWFLAFTGVSIDDLVGWDRNNYDRLVHLLWGLCLTQPICETFLQRLQASHRAASHLSLHVVLSTSAIYELLEWAAAVTFGEGGTAYVGAQGDSWDAQADIAICLVGWGLVVGLRTIRHVLPGVQKP